MFLQTSTSPVNSAGFVPEATEGTGAMRAGKPAAAIVAKARAQVAALLGAHDDEIVFTSGGSESNKSAEGAGGNKFGQHSHG